MILGMVKPADPPLPTPFAAKNNDQDTSEPIKPFGWLYIGSHNLSVSLFPSHPNSDWTDYLRDDHSTPAAWGRYSEKSGSLSLANHELGVVIPLREDDVEAQASKLVTWKRPLVKYGKDDTPWVSALPNKWTSCELMKLTEQDQFKYGK